MQDCQEQTTGNMCCGIESRIKSLVPIPVYSQVITSLNGVNGGGFLEINNDFMDRGAKCIILHSIILGISNNVGAVYTLTDGFNNVLLKFQATNAVQMNGCYNLNYIIESSRIKLTLDSSLPLVDFFTAQYQYVYNQESKLLK